MVGKQKGRRDWPLGDYLRKHRGTLSMREAARRAGISEGRWRQVEAGYQNVGGGLTAPVTPRPETLAAMCRVIGADISEALQLMGLDPADYTWLTEPQPDESDVPFSNERDREWFMSLPREEREAVLVELQRLHLDAELTRQPGRRSRKAAG